MRPPRRRLCKPVAHPGRGTNRILTALPLGILKIVIACVCACVLAVTLVAQRREFYVAPDGRPDADGSRERPWDLQTALAQPSAVRPGATIWIRGGRYTGAFVSRLQGSADAYITVRAYPAERPILDNPLPDPTTLLPTLTIEGQYATVWGLEVTSSTPKRVSTGPAVRPTGINVYGPHTKLINNIVHDTGDCIGHWQQAAGSEITGNVMYFCGWDGPDRGHGHGLYIQNSGDPKEVRDNILFDEFGFGIHAYTEQGAIDDLRFRRNVSFDAGVLSAVTPGNARNVLVGGRKVVKRPVLEGNFTYRLNGTNSLGYRVGSENGVVSGNYFVEGSSGAALTLIDPQDLKLTGNHFYGAVTNASRYPDNEYETEPHGVWRFVLPNPYDDRRATLVIYNWDDAETVTVDAPAFLAPGDAYELRNVQDYFQDVVTRTYSGGPIDVSMRNHTVAAPIGWHRPPTTFPRFGVFVLIKATR